MINDDFGVEILKLLDHVRKKYAHAMKEKDRKALLDLNKKLYDKVGGIVKDPMVLPRSNPFSGAPKGTTGFAGATPPARQAESIDLQRLTQLVIENMLREEDLQEFGWQDVKRNAKKFATGAAMVGTLAGASPAFAQTAKPAQQQTAQHKGTFSANSTRDLFDGLQKQGVTFDVKERLKSVEAAPSRNHQGKGTVQIKDQSGKSWNIRFDQQIKSGMWSANQL